MQCFFRERMKVSDENTGRDSKAATRAGNDPKFIWQGFVPAGCRIDPPLAGEPGINLRAVASSLGCALRIPIVFLTARMAAPGVESVIHHEPVAELLVVVAEIVGESEGNGEQARTRRMERVAVRIGPAHDECEFRERRIG